MIELVAIILLTLVRFILMYVVPLFNTIKLQSLPDETNSDKNRRMLIYWILVVLLYVVRHILFFVNSYLLDLVEVAFVIWLFYPRRNGLSIITDKLLTALNKPKASLEKAN